MVSLFKHKSFLCFFLAQLISKFGDGITTIIILYLVGTLSKDPLFIGLVLFAQYGPMLLFGFFTGTIADRFPKHYLMIGTDLYRAIIIVIMTFCTHSVWLLICLVFLAGIGNAISFPARSSFIPKLVGENNIAEALSITQSVNSVMQIAGPGIAGILLVFTSPSNILIIDTLSFLLSAFFLSLTAIFLKYKEPFKKDPQSHLSLWTSIRDGVTTVFTLAPLRFLITLLIQIMFAAGIFNTTSTSLILQVFNVSSFHFGMIEAMAGVGAFCGALIGPFLLRRIKPGYLLFFSTAFMGGWMILIFVLQYFPNSYSTGSLYIWVLMIGLINALLNIPISSLFLGLTPDIYRGRAMAILQMASNTGLLLGIVIAGLLSKFLGAVLVTTIAGFLLLIISIITVKMRGFKALLSIDKRAQNKKSMVV